MKNYDVALFKCIVPVEDLKKGASIKYGIKCTEVKSFETEEEAKDYLKSKKTKIEDSEWEFYKVFSEYQLIAYDIDQSIGLFDAVVRGFSEMEVKA